MGGKKAIRKTASTGIEIKFSQRLRYLRKKYKLTQQELAENANVDYKHIQKLESATPPSVTLGTIEKIARAFNLSASQLLKSL